jgi:hypothetical protein
MLPAKIDSRFEPLTSARDEAIGADHFPFRIGSGGSMSARFLLAVFDSVYLVALTAWVGSILFFSFGESPIIFNVLGEQTGGKYVRALFPRYYLWGAISGAIALPAFVAGPLCYHEYRGPMVGVQAAVILAGILVMLYAGNSLAPAINHARDGGPAGRVLFKRLHRRAVWLNAMVLVMGLGLLIAFATRQAPRTSGIVELTPEERVRYDAAVIRVIHDVEAKYGLRPPRIKPSGESADRDLLIDDATVAEIESFYKRNADRDRNKFDLNRSPNSGRAAQPPEPSSSAPGKAQSARSGER